MAFREKKQPEKREDTVKSEITRRFKTHPFLFVGTVVILVIVIIAFVFVPAIVPNVGGGGELVFGYYNRVPVKYVQNNYFSQTLQRLMQSQRPPENDPNYFFTVAMMWQQAFQESVIRVGILDEMKEAGYRAPEKVVDREVAENINLQENGRFSAAKYRALSNNARLNLWRETAENVTAGIFVQDMMSLRTSSGETDFIASMGSPRRTFDLAIFPLTLYPDSEIAAYAAANKDLFRVTRLSIITINSGEREAAQILESVKNGTSTFEEAAKTNSQDMYAEQSGDMGIRMAHELIALVNDEGEREEVINLATGEVSNLIEVPEGWAFFRAEDAVREADLNDAAQLENIWNYIMNNARGQVENWLIAEAEKFSAQVRTLGFDDALAGSIIVTSGLTETAPGSRTAVNVVDKKTLGPLPVNYGDTAIFETVSASEIPELSGAERNEFFWKAAFTTPLNTPSNPLVIGNSVIVLFPVEESVAEEGEVGQMMEFYYPYWMSKGAEQVYRSSFLTNEKFDNRFDEAFGKLWQ